MRTAAARTGVRAGKSTTPATKRASNIVAALRHKFHKGGSEISLLSQSQALSSVTEYISTGFIGLDDILGGGFAVGRCSEVYGPEGSGKTALAQMVTRSCQRMGGMVLYLDFENALDEEKIAQLGIDPEMLLYARPPHMEAAWDIIWEFIDQLKKDPPDAPALVLWDSLAATPTKDEVGSAAASSQVAVAARQLSKGCRRMFSEIALVRAHMLFINQERDAIGKFSPMGTPKSTFGGSSVKYAASQRCRCVKKMTIKSKGNEGPAIGYLINTRTDKNRCAPPHQNAAWVLDFRYGPSPELTMRQVLMDAQKIKTNGKIGRKTAYSGVWGDGPFKSHRQFTKGMWMTLLAEDEDFRAGAEAEYLEVVRAGGSMAVLKAATSVPLEDGENPEDFDDSEDSAGSEELDPVVG